MNKITVANICLTKGWMFEVFRWKGDRDEDFYKRKICIAFDAGFGKT